MLAMGSRSRRLSLGPYCFLLLVASLVEQASGASGFEGNRAPPRGATSASSSLSGRQHAGGKTAASDQRADDSKIARGSPRDSLSPAMYPRLSSRLGGEDAQRTGGGIGDGMSSRSRVEGSAGGDGDHAREGPRSGYSSVSTMSGGRRGGLGASDSARIAGDSIAEIRQQAFSAARRARADPLNSVRDGEGGWPEKLAAQGGATGQQLHQYDQDFQGEDQQELQGHWRGALNEDDGLGAGQGPALRASPPRTPLQEQVYQTQYRHQHGQIPGQAVGTQQRASSLFRRAGGGGVFFIFFVLVWRSLSNYEHVDQMKGGTLRTVTLVPAVGLFVGNLLCMCLALVQSATTRQKARMKTMLTIDAVAEGALFLYNLAGLMGGERTTPREEFISRVLANAWFLSMCFTFAKARWVADGAY